MKNKVILSIYLGFSLFYLAITALNQEEFARLLKPFLLPLLLLAVFFTDTFGTKKILLTALTFS